ncbi:hypothetical protein GCM10027435_10070 [Haloparvum alkalitolerans]|uniref:replication factor C small subunit n=1 Tax=Haloparvum alkalitolerans TaxID=1042953 RepID=UPI003CE86C36
MSEAEGDEDDAAAATGREIWIEKYRPQTLDDIHGQEEIVERLQSYIDQEDIPHLLFAGPAGVGKCVTGDTPVLTDAGLERIEDVAGETEGFADADPELSVATLADDGSVEYGSPSHVFGKEADELVEIETRDGGSFRVTPEHKLRVVDGEGFDWIPARDLSNGERIARPRRVPTPDGPAELPWMEAMDPERTEVTLTDDAAADFGVDAPVTLARLAVADRPIDPEDVARIEYVNVHGHRSRSITPPPAVTPEVARFVGLAVSEARIEGGRIKFYNTDEKLLDAFEDAAHDCFDVETTRGVQQDVPFVRIGSRTLTHYLESVFDVFAGASRKGGIGSAILRADAESRAAFVRAMFDAEAHVGAQGTVELTQKNEDHVTLLAYLLSTFGIPSRQKDLTKSATNGSETERTYRVLYLSGASALSRFREEIGFSVDYKADELARHAAKESNPNFDTIPTQTVLRDLCNRFDVPVTEHLPKSLDPDSPGREAYCAALDSAVGAALERMDDAQRALERLDEIQPEIEATASVPAAWVDGRAELAPIETRHEVSEAVGARADRLLEYSDGRRTPRADRALTILDRIGRPVEGARLDRVKEGLRDSIDLLGVSYAEIVEDLELTTADLTNLLRSDDSEVRSLTRFVSVAERLRSLANRRLSLDAIEQVDKANRLADNDLYYDCVESVERVEADERVYDLTMPGTRNYVAGRVPTVMHNTTAATAIAREVYGEDDWRGNFLELNASDQRGIDVVRDRIKSFARSSFGGHDHRIIFLDEADSLTDDAQSALRRTMEQFSDNTRFILSCNYSSKIIDPIQSRCAVFRFSPLSDEAVAAQVREIAANEGIEVTEEGVDALVYAANGDMRRAINSLQAAATTGEVVDEEAVYAITATARPEEIESMVRDALNGDFSKARATLDTLLTETGMAGGDVIDQLHRSVWEFDLSEREAVRLMERVGEADYRISEGANEQVQLESLLASLAVEA